MTRRRRTVTTTAAVLGAASFWMGPSAVSAPSPAPLVGGTDGHGSYLVVIKDPVGLRAAGLGGTKVSAQAITASAVRRGQHLGAHVRRQLSGLVSGYSATLTAGQLDAVRRDPTVAYVQPNRRYHPAVTGAAVSQPLEDGAGGADSWGLDRVDQRELPLNQHYRYTATGKGVNAYVVDTGIVATHPDLGGRVKTGFDAVGDGNGTDDCDGVDRSKPGAEDPDADEGHGTHVAGVIGGTRYGLAKGVSLVPVRVLDCDGFADSDDVIAGLDWIRQHRGSTPSVANLSLATSDTDPTLDAAVASLVKSGVTVVAAAGNGDDLQIGQSAFKVSPAHVKSVITVGATDRKDRRPTFSNFGSCVDLYAPGVDVTSDWVDGVSGGSRVHQVASESGTSMAAPHVAGAAAMYLQKHPKATPAQVSIALAGAATPDQVTAVSTKQPRDLLYAVQKVAPPAGAVDGAVPAGHALLSGTRICSASDAYCLTQGGRDGALVLYAVKDNHYVWTSRKGGAWTLVTTVGGLASYDAWGDRTWSNGSTGGPATLTVTDTGHATLRRTSDHRLLWSTP